jgi:hypothetical protein
MILCARCFKLLCQRKVPDSVNHKICSLIQEVEKDVKARTKGELGAAKTLCTPFDQPDLPCGMLCIQLTVLLLVLHLEFLFRYTSTESYIHPSITTAWWCSAQKNTGTVCFASGKPAIKWSFWGRSYWSPWPATLVFSSSICPGKAVCCIPYLRWFCNTVIAGYIIHFFGIHVRHMNPDVCIKILQLWQRNVLIKVTIFPIICYVCCFFFSSARLCFWKKRDLDIFKIS